MVLREMTSADVPAVVAWERHSENSAFIMPWSAARHLSALEDADCRYFIIEDEGRSVGFVLLAGLQGENSAIEFRRIVVAEKGQGFGRAAVEAVKGYCFEVLDAHRLWLDVFDDNSRARSLYASAGFRLEGTLRESVKTPGGFRSLVVMSMLQPEYAAARE